MGERPLFFALSVAIILFSGCGGDTTVESLDTTAPIAPAALTATAVSTSRIDLSWDASTDNIGVAGYRVYRGGTFYTTATGTGFSNTGLTASTQYCYAVSAVDAAGNESALSVQVCATTFSPDTQAPAVPSGLAAVTASGTRIDLSWAASTDNVGVAGYKIYRDGSYVKSVTTTTSADTGLTAATSYCYTVTAYDAAANESAQSVQSCTTTAAEGIAPTTPTNLTTTPVSTSQIDLSWSASTDNVGVTGYNLYRNGTYLMSTAATATSDAGLTIGTFYCYAVSAYDAAGNESALIAEQCTSTLWNTTTVVNGLAYGDNISLAIDAGGKVHISFYNSNVLKYTTNALGSWSTTTVDSTIGVGSYSSIALDASGKVHISYYDSMNGNLKYATNSLGSWSTTTIDSAGYVGVHTSLAIDSAGKVHISYYDGTNANLKYATNTSGSWVATTIDSNSYDVDANTSIAIDSTGKVHISYVDTTNMRLRYATNTFGSWMLSWVSSSYCSGYASLALDGNDKVHIAYSDGMGWLSYATNVTGTFVISTIDGAVGAGSYCSIALDAAGGVMVSYHDVIGDDLKFAHKPLGQSWMTAAIDSAGDTGWDTSIAVEPSGQVHISYFDFTNGNLRYATNK